MSGRVTRLNVEEGETAIMGTLNRMPHAAHDQRHERAGDQGARGRDRRRPHLRWRLGRGPDRCVPDTTFLGRVVEISNSSVRAAPATATDQAIDYEVTVELILNAPPTRARTSRPRPRSSPTRAAGALDSDHRADRARERGTANTDSGRWAGGTPSDQVGKRDVEGVFVVGRTTK
jgi:HlyD family secretion protein